MKASGKHLGSTNKLLTENHESKMRLVKTHSNTGGLPCEATEPAEGASGRKKEKKNVPGTYYPCIRRG